MRVRTVLWGAVLGGLALALAAWVVLRGPPAGGPPPRSGQGVENVRKTPAPAAPALDAPLAGNAPAPPEPEARTESEPPDAGFNLHGTLVIVDPEGEEHAEEDGSLRLLAWKGNRGTGPPRIQVEKGRWKAHFSPQTREGADLAITEVVAGGREAVVEPDRVPFPEDGVLEIRAVWPPDLELKVLGEDTRADLAGVTVIHARDHHLDHMDYPGAYAEEDVLAHDERSPVAIRPAAKKGPARHAILWAGSPGYAWARIAVDFKAGGERLLVLKRAANLHVILANHRAAQEGERELVVRVRRPEEPDPDPPGTTLDDILKALDAGKVEPGPGMTREELRKQLTERKAALDARTGTGAGTGTGEEAIADSSRGRAGEPIAEAPPPETGPLRFDGLPPGKYLVRAEVGEVFRDPLVLAGAPVALEAGATASVTLVLGERPRSGEPVPLAGTLYLPEAWGPSKLSLSIEPLNRPQAKKEDRLRVHLQDMEPVQGQPGLYRWDAGSVVPGTYQAQLNDFQYQMVIEVGAAGRRDVEIRIGEPALVAVRVVDAETGSNVDAGEVLWNCRRPEGIHGGGMNSVPRDAATDSYRFRAPVGPISVDVHPTGYLYAHQTLDVVPGENALTLEVTKGCGLIITVREGDLALPWDLVDKALKIREVDGKGGMRGWQKRGQAKTFNLSRPGTYELKVAKLDGYAPVAPVTVEVRKGEYREHTIELRRE